MGVACVVLAACGDPAPVPDPTAELTTECDKCVKDRRYNVDLAVHIEHEGELQLTLEHSSEPFGDGSLSFQEPLGTYTDQLLLDYILEKGDSTVSVGFKCGRAGVATIRVAGAYPDDLSITLFELFDEIECVVNPPDIEVRGPNGGVIPSLGNDDAGVKAHGVQFTREYTIKNVGTGPLEVMSTSFGTGTNCTGAVLVQANPPTIAPGAMGSLTVGVTPTAQGPFECEWALANSDADENPYSVTVSGTAPSGDIAITAPSSTGAIPDGGQQAVGTKPARVAFTETYRIDNDGLSTLTVGAATIGTRLNCAVSISSQPLMTPLPPQTIGATSLVLSITPIGPGPFTCDVSVPSNDPDAENPYTWTISGIATAPEIDVANQPDASMVDLGAVRTGAATSRSFLVSNTGTGTLTISAVTPGSMTNCTLAVTMAPAASVMAAGMTMFTISVTPTAEGAFSCAFDITNNDADEAFYDLFVIGTGVAPRIALDGPGGPLVQQATDDLGGGHQATIAFSRTYTIRNIGTAPLTVSSVSTLGPVCTNCFDLVTAPAMTTIPVGGSTTFSIQWTPSAAGTFGHSYRILSDATNAPAFEFAATGIATAAPAPDVGVLHDGSPVFPMTNLSLGTFPGTAPIELDFQISNLGDANLVVTSVDTPGSPPPTNVTVVVSGGTGTITPLTSTTFHVTATPSDTGQFSFRLRIFSNDPSPATAFEFSVSGVVALPPEIDVTGFASGSTDNVGTVAPGSPFTRTYTIQNTRTGTLQLTGNTFTTTNCTASVTTAPASPVAAGGMTTISVGVTPTAAGAFSCTLQLANNDTTGGENPYTITISGTAAASIGNFGSMLGNYIGDNNCGIQTWALENVGGLRVDGFRDNPNDIPLTVGANPDVATGTNFVIFGTPGATCTFTKQGNFTIVIFCSHPGGGSCTEIASKL